MKTYEAIFFLKDCGNDFYVILKEGQCAFETRRKIAFDSCKENQYGDKILMQQAENGEIFKDNPYFKIIEKKQSSFEEREQNLFYATELFIKNAYSTQNEINSNIVPTANGEKFAESFYYEEIANMFESIVKLYRKEKMFKCASFAKKIYDEFNNNAQNTLGRNVDEVGEFSEYPKYIARIRKKHFNMFTSTDKIIKSIHLMIQDDAMKKLESIKCFSKENCKKKVELRDEYEVK